MRSFTVVEVTRFQCNKLSVYFLGGGGGGRHKHFFFNLDGKVNLPSQKFKQPLPPAPALRQSNSRDCEKSWVHLSNGGEMKVVQ